jgi:RNA polymerase sigma factor (sigma-70 family)
VVHPKNLPRISDIFASSHPRIDGFVQRTFSFGVENRITRCPFGSRSAIVRMRERKDIRLRGDSARFSSTREPTVDETAFSDLVKRVRAGDPAAIAQFMRRYEATILRTFKIRLFRDSRMRRRRDSEDFTQSVWAAFFEQLGKSEGEDEQQVLQLLGCIAKRRVAYYFRQERAPCRDYACEEATHDRELEEPSDNPTPSRHLMNQELEEEFLRRMLPRERELHELRKQGRSWAEIARELGGSPDQLRKQLERARTRVAKELGIEEPADE